MKVVFMGTPSFAVPSLDAIIAADHNVVGVYCQPPRPAGRGNKLRKSNVQSRAEEYGLQVFSPTELTSKAQQEGVTALAPDIIVVVAYGLILPQSLLYASRFGCLNIHASLLPRWRGAAPIQRAIMAGDKQTGISVMKMDKGLDTGPILLRKKIPIHPHDTAANLHDRLSTLGAQLIVSALERVADIVPTPQPPSGITYAHKINKSEGQIDWSQTAEEVDCRIRGLSPFPGAWIKLGSDRVKLLSSSPRNKRGKPGDVLDDALTIACGTGAIQILRLQRNGKAPQAADEFLRGFPIRRGTCLTGS